VSFFALALWLAVTAGTDLVGRHEPDVSGLGIVLAIASLVVMPVLAAEKRRVGTRMGAVTVVADSAQTWLCTALSAVLLLGLGANAAFGWWWADPLAALVIAVVAAREGVEAWRGENCCAPTVDVESCCVVGGCG
jgi:divalent metal cation (Fe/Co/Zn/Cd) transporter